MRAGENADEVRLGDEERSAGEAAQTDAARLVADKRVALGHAGVLGEGDVDSAQELAAEAWGALLVPAGGLRDGCLGRVADDQAHASAGLVQALLDAGAYDRPALAGLGVTLELGEPAIELGGLRGDG